MRTLCALILISGLRGQVVDLGGLSPAEQEAGRTPITNQQRVLLKTGVHRSLRSVSLPPAGGRIRSAGAEAVRVHLTGVDLGDGSLEIRAAQGGDAVTYTGRGPQGDGEFWSHSVFGEEAVVEFKAGPSGVSAAWRVSEISHAFRRAADADPLDPLRCHLDSNCHAEWGETAKSVAMFRFETPQGQSACTGALVRTKSGSGVPYFLTANHCVGDEQTARSVETYWNYTTASCNAKTADITKAIRPKVAGARYVAGITPEKGDASLLVLNSIPPEARFANYDPADPAVGAPVVGIHHPLASYRRISFGDSFVGYWNFGSGNPFPAQLFHQIRWQGGDIYFGSSGSPLFSRANTITGMASHIAQFDELSHCDQNPKVVGYAKLSVAWPLFQPFLDDATPSALTVAPAELQITLENGAVRDGLRRRLVVNSTSEAPVPVSVTAADTWLRLANPQGTAQVGSPFVTEVEIRPELLTNRSGLLRSRVTVVSGNNGRVVPVDADVIVVASNVALGAKSTAVENAADGCRYRLDVTVNERTGVSTELTALRINGEDYTTQIRDWFGSSQLQGKGNLTASLKVCWPGVLDAYPLILAGRDAGSGRTWSQSAIVEFQ